MPENNNNSQSPIKDIPAQMPDKSLREHVEYLFDEGVIPWLTFAVCMIVIAGLEWFAVFYHTPRFPWIFTVIAAVIILMAAVKIRQAIRKAKHWRRD